MDYADVEVMIQDLRAEMQDKIDDLQRDIEDLRERMPDDCEHVDDGPVQIAEHFHPGEFYGCRKDHRQERRP
jgi:hypothetical protein